MTGALTVRFIRDGASLSALAPEWWRLWQHTPAATPFQTPGWLIPWWQAFAPGELLTLAVHMGHRLVGLAPFYLDRDAARLRILPVGISVSDYLDVLVDPAVEEPVLAAISGGYARCPEPWAEWEMSELRPGALALRLPTPHGCDDTLQASVPCTVLCLPDAGGAAAALPPRMRRKLRMARNRIDRHGRARILEACDRDIGWWVAELWRLHQARWTSRGEPGLLRDGRLRPFHLGAMTGLAGRNILRLYALMLGAQVVGVYYGSQHGRLACAYLSGFDPQFAYYSPSTFLIGHAIGQAAAEGGREMHFLRGDEDYKYAWGVTERWNSRRVLRRCPP